MGSWIFRDVTDDGKKATEAGAGKSRLKHSNI